MFLFSRKNKAKPITEIAFQKLALSGCQLAQSEHFVEYIEAIRSLVALPEEHYALFYQAPLETFLALLQVMPCRNIQQKLECVANAFKLRRLHNLPQGVNARMYTDTRIYGHIPFSSLPYSINCPTLLRTRYFTVSIVRVPFGIPIVAY